MFLDGLRVFTGQSRTQHTLEDFEPISRNTKVPQATRKLVGSLRPGWNGAWAAETKTSGGQLVAKRTWTPRAASRDGVDDAQQLIGRYRCPRTRGGQDWQEVNGGTEQ